MFWGEAKRRGLPSETHACNRVLFALPFCVAQMASAGRLTGGLRGAVVTPERKREFLLTQSRSCCQGECALLEGDEVCRCEGALAAAVGDGANDIPMLLTAATGVAFCAKPSVRRAAHECLDTRDLSLLKFYLGVEVGTGVRTAAQRLGWPAFLTGPRCCRLAFDFRRRLQTKTDCSCVARRPRGGRPDGKRRTKLNKSSFCEAGDNNEAKRSRGGCVLSCAMRCRSAIHSAL